MQRKSLKTVYFNHRMLALLGLGFASGLPGAWSLFDTPLQSWLLDVGINVEDVKLMSLISIPFAFNFAWAPLLDRYNPPVFGWLGHRRGWLLLIQIVLFAGISLLALAGPSSDTDSLLGFSIIGVCVAVAAATQDVLCDAYRTDVLPREELGAGAAVFVNGYRLAMLFAGAAALKLSTMMVWQTVFLILAACMGIGIVATLIAPKPAGPELRPATLVNAFIEPAIDFFKRNGLHAIVLLVFIILFKLPDSLARAMTIPLLKSELQFSADQIAFCRETLGIGAMIIGAFAGGAVVARMGIVRSLWVLGALQLLTNLGFTWLAMVGNNVMLMTGVVVVESFCGGMVTAGFVALLMSLCNKRYTATQYALFTSLNHFTGTITSAFSGFAVKAMGYPAYFAVTAAVGLPAMALLLLIREPQDPQAGDEPADQLDQSQSPGAPQ